MTNVIIIHGTEGSPEGNWFPWLKKEFERIGCNVFVPRFPTPENQSLQSWLNTFKEYEQYLDEDTIVIGHSLGPAFLLSVLEKLKRPIKSAFFASGFTELLGNDYDRFNKTFVVKKFNWVKIKKNCKTFYVINSDTDPYVPLEKGKDLAKNLGTELIILRGAGHINLESGYDKFDILLEMVKKEINK